MNSLEQNVAIAVSETDNKCCDPNDFETKSSLCQIDGRDSDELNEERTRIEVKMPPTKSKSKTKAINVIGDKDNSEEKELERASKVS